MRWTVGAGLTVICLVTGCTQDQVAPLEPQRNDPPSMAAAAKDVPVTSQLLGSGRIQSDGNGPYRNGTNGVSSVIQAVGDWVLDLSGKKSTRKARLDFTDPLPGNPGTAPFAVELVAPRFIARAGLLNSGGFTSMRGLGSTRLTPLSLAFTHGGVSYGLRMNPDNHPGTDWALITCTAVEDAANPATSACKAWTVTPTGSHDGVTKNVAYLERVGNPSTMVGLYYMTFDIAVAK